MESALLPWVRAKHYCTQTGETMDAIYKRRSKGQWIDGVQCKLDPLGNLWINLPEVRKWLETGEASPFRAG